MAGYQSFSTVFDRQLHYMQRQVELAETRGYCVLVNGQRNAALEPGMLAPGTMAFFQAMVDGWCHLRNRKPYACVWVTPTPADMAYVTSSGKFTLSAGTVTYVGIPTVKRYEPIVSSLRLMSRIRKVAAREASVTGAGPLEMTERSARAEFRTTGPDGLKIIVGVLNMPHHRRILLEG